MISQVTNSAGMPPVSSAPALPADVRQQKTAARAELPSLAVRAPDREEPARATEDASRKVEKVDTETAKKAAEQINKVMEQFNTNIQFSVDEDTKANVVKVIDSETEEVIRQIPTKEMLEIAKALDNLQGLLVRDKA